MKIYFFTTALFIYIFNVYFLKVVCVSYHWLQQNTSAPLLVSANRF